MQKGNYEKFADLIKGYLRAEYRDPTWLARRLELSSSTVSKWLNEHTRPGNAKIVGRIASIFKLSAEQREELFDAAGYIYRLSVNAPNQDEIQEDETVTELPEPEPDSPQDIGNSGTETSVLVEDNPPTIDNGTNAAVGENDTNNTPDQPDSTPLTPPTRTAIPYLPSQSAAILLSLFAILVPVVMGLFYNLPKAPVMPTPAPTATETVTLTATTTDTPVPTARTPTREPVKRLPPPYCPEPGVIAMDCLLNVDMVALASNQMEAGSSITLTGYFTALNYLVSGSAKENTLFSMDINRADPAYIDENWVFTVTLESSVNSNILVLGKPSFLTAKVPVGIGMEFYIHELGPCYDCAYTPPTSTPTPSPMGR